jgi:hypothetical protein
MYKNMLYIHKYMLYKGNPEGRRPSGRLRARLEDNIKTEAGSASMGWLDLAQDRDR